MVKIKVGFLKIAAVKLDSVDLSNATVQKTAQIFLQLLEWVRTFIPNTAWICCIFSSNRNMSSVTFIPKMVDCPNCDWSKLLKFQPGVQFSTKIEWKPQKCFPIGDKRPDWGEPWKC